MITFKQLQEKLSDKEYKEVDALLNRDTLLRGNLIKNYAQRGKFETMKARDTFRRIKKNEDGKLRIDRGTEKKIKVNTQTVSKNFPELFKKRAKKYANQYTLPPVRSIDDRLKEKEAIKKKYATEGVAALALKGGSKLIPALMTGIGAAGTIMQAKRKYRTRLNPGKRNSGRVLSPAEKKIFDKSQRDTDQKVTDQKPRDKVVKKILDRKYEKNRERMKIPNRIQSDRRRLLRGIAKGEVMLDQFTPTNNVGDGKIAGTVEAGDDPPVKKKKRYIYGGKGSRRMWMNNK